MSSVINLNEARRQGVRPDLRNIEARAHAITHGRGHKKLVKAKTKKSDRQMGARKKKFEKTITAELKKLDAGAASVKQVIDTTSKEIRKAYSDAFTLGLEAQGQGVFNPKRYGRQTDVDREEVSVAANTQIRYMKKFVGEVGRGEVPDGTEKYDDDQPRPRKMRMDRRIGMYSRAVDSMYDAGQVAGAPAGTVIHWVRGCTESCPECIYLEKHSPYTKDSLPTTPRAGRTRCLSNCKCRLVFDLPKGRVFDVVEKVQKSRAYYRSRLTASRKKKHGLPEIASSYLKECLLHEENKRWSRLIF